MFPFYPGQRAGVVSSHFVCFNRFLIMATFY